MLLLGMLEEGVAWPTITDLIHSSPQKIQLTNTRKEGEELPTSLYHAFVSWPIQGRGIRTSSGNVIRSKLGVEEEGEVLEACRRRNCA